MLVLDNVIFHRGAFTLRADLTIPKGAQIALTGPSGIGKSTFFDLIAGFEQPSAGHMSWDGRDITPLPPAQRPVAVMFQDHNLFSHLSVMKNLTLAMGQGKDAAAISRLLDQLEIGAYAHTRPTDLSGGQLARAALARVSRARGSAGSGADPHGPVARPCQAAALHAVASEQAAP